MPALFPVLAIALIFVFISAHSAAFPPKPKKKKTPTAELAEAFEKVIKSTCDKSGGKDD
ncbi:MAG: hypothetical protein WBD47_12855 [Phormidesmis sp.]